MAQEPITIKQTIAAPLQKVWNYWTAPEHITQWNAASDDWYTPRAVSDVKPGGRFSYRMEARDGSVGFDFEGTYDAVSENTLAYTLGDGRKAWVLFSETGGGTAVTQRFEPETQNPTDMQQAGWQAILDNFKKYTEAH